MFSLVFNAFMFKYRAEDRSCVLMFYKMSEINVRKCMTKAEVTRPSQNGTTWMAHMAPNLNNNTFKKKL